MRPHLLLVCAALVACGGVDPSEETQDVAVPRHLFTLANAPFPGSHPTALVYFGKGFSPDGPLNLVVHYHGWANCIENDGEARGSACTRGGPVRIAHNLIGQLDKSGANAALLLVERAFDQNSSADGRLAEAGFFRAMILELLPHLGALAGRDYTESDLGSIALSSHSGGYIALAHTLDRGGLTDHVKQVILLDSVYGNLAQFEAYARSGGRLAVVYTDNAGTLANSQHMANDLRAFSPFDDRTYSTLTDAQFEAPLLFKRSALSHDGTAQYYFGKLLAHAGLR
ncbi:MAG: hypothetical protein ACXWLM_10975 [Myxococcales bacterium]